MQRRRHCASFKAQVTLEAIREDLTVAEISKKHNLHPGQVQAWKTEALWKLSSLFERGSSPESNSEEEVALIERKVGQLTIENDFLKKWTGYQKFSFTGIVDVNICESQVDHLTGQRNNCTINGIYQYSSSYSNLFNVVGAAGTVVFPVELHLDPSYVLLNPNNITGRCRIINLKESVLGENDFVSDPHRLDPCKMNVPMASLYHILDFNSKAIRQTNGIIRLEVNTINYLMLLNELLYGNLHSLSESERLLEGKRLYRELLIKKRV